MGVEINTNAELVSGDSRASDTMKDLFDNPDATELSNNEPDVEVKDYSQEDIDKFTEGYEEAKGKKKKKEMIQYMKSQFGGEMPKGDEVVNKPYTIIEEDPTDLTMNIEKTYDYMLIKDNGKLTLYKKFTKEESVEKPWSDKLEEIKANQAWANEIAEGKLANYEAINPKDIPKHIGKPKVNAAKFGWEGSPDGKIGYVYVQGTQKDFYAFKGEWLG